MQNFCICSLTVVARWSKPCKSCLAVMLDKPILDPVNFALILNAKFLMFLMQLFGISTGRSFVPACTIMCEGSDLTLMAFTSAFISSAVLPGNIRFVTFLREIFLGSTCLIIESPIIKIELSLSGSVIDSLVEELKDELSRQILF